MYWYRWRTMTTLFTEKLFCQVRQQLDSDVYCILEGLYGFFYFEFWNRVGGGLWDSVWRRKFNSDTNNHIILQWYRNIAWRRTTFDQLIEKGSIEPRYKHRTVWKRWLRHEKGIARCSRTRKLLENTFEIHREIVWLAERRTKLDLWIGWEWALLDQVEKFTWRYDITNGGGRSSLQRRDAHRNTAIMTLMCGRPDTMDTAILHSYRTFLYTYRSRIPPKCSYQK